MRIKSYNGYISSLLVGKISYYPLYYIFSLFIISSFAVGFWGFLPSFSPKAAIITLLFIVFFLITIGIGLISEIISLLSPKYKDSRKKKTNESLEKLYNNPSFLIDIFPVKKEDIIITACLEKAFEVSMILLFGIIGLLVLNNESKFISIRGLINILSISLSIFFTFVNISNFKLFIKSNVKSSTKNEIKSTKDSKILIIVRSMILLLIGFTFTSSTNFIYAKFENILSRFLDSILSSSILSFLGNFYVGLALLSITTLIVIYFNYFCLTKKKLKELDTVSNWREI